MLNRISLTALAKSMEVEFYNQSETGKVSHSYKTVIRRFDDFITAIGLDISKLKNENNEIYLDETEAVYIKGLMIQSIDKNAFFIETSLKPMTEMKLPPQHLKISHHLWGICPDT